MNEQERLALESWKNSMPPMIPATPTLALDPWLWLVGQILYAGGGVTYAKKVSDDIMDAYQKRQNRVEESAKYDHRMATSKVETPTVPGYYWAKDDNEWFMVKVGFNFGQLRASSIVNDQGTHSWDVPLTRFTAWHGPLPTPDGGRQDWE